MLDLLREFDRQEKWIFSICHGIQLVAAAGLAKGKTVTCYEHIRLEVETSGGRYVARDAMRDGRLVSSPTWREHPAFSREIFTCLSPMAGARPSPHRRSVKVQPAPRTSALLTLSFVVRYNL